MKNKVNAAAKTTPAGRAAAYTGSMHEVDLDVGVDADEAFFVAAQSAPDAGVDDTRIAMLFRMGRAAYLVSPVYAGIVLMILWRDTWADALIGWFCALLAVIAARVLVHAAYLRAQGRPPRRWERRFALGAFASGAAWAAIPTLFFASEDPLLLMAAVFVVGGTLITAAALYAASVLSVYAYVVPPLAGLIGQLAVQPDAAYRYLALVIGLFGVVIVRIHRELNHSLLDTLRARLENETLRSRAQESETRMRDAIESFPEGIAIFDDGASLVTCNDAFARRYGGERGREALAGAAYRDLCAAAFEVEEPRSEIAARRREWIESRLDDLRAGRSAPRQFRSPDGRWFQSRIMRTAFGGFVWTFSDITELKSSQDAYLALLAQEDLLLNTLPLGVAFV